MVTKTKLESAQYLASLGFHVFRCQPDRKWGFKGWQEEATNNPAAINTLFAGSDAYNIGIFTEKFRDNEALIVVDVDTKPGKDGANSLAMLDAMGYTLPETWTQTTASGGKHFIYSNPLPLRGGSKKLFNLPDIDIKSYGGLIIGAGSEIKGSFYTLDTLGLDSPAPAPQWLLPLLGKVSLSEKPVMDNLTIDNDYDVARAIDYLSNTAPPAIEGQGGDNQTVLTANYLGDMGLSPEKSLELMDIYYNPRCIPPWEFDALSTKVFSAFSSRQNAIGVSSPTLDFETYDEATIARATRPIDKKGLFYVTADELDPDFSTQKALIKGIIDPLAMSVLYGESNTGKTFVALDMAYHIATGTPYDDRPVLQGGVIYIATEAGRSAQNRLLAIRKAFNVTAFLPLFLVPCAINLLDSDADLKALTALIDNVKKANPDHPIQLIVVDTLSRAMAGGNENSPDDMGAFVRNIDRIRTTTPAHVMIVHHSGKDTARGARGHSLLRAATDTELEVADNMITAKKQRDMEYGKPTGFALDIVELGFDAYNEKVTSCVVKKLDANIIASDKARKEGLEARDQVALFTLMGCRTGKTLGGYTDVVDTKTWAQACKDSNIAAVPGAKNWPVTANSFNVAFKRCRDRLVTFDMVLEVEPDQWVVIK